MNPSEQHFVSCQRCGRQIEEQCAIEEDGLLLCGDCVVAQTKREVDQAEAASTKLRQQQREQQLREIRRQQGQRAVLLLLRLVAVAGADITQLTWVLASIAVLSMTLGNLTALVQTDLKRLLAYSSIAHAGYVMLGILSVDELGMAAAVFYV
ncbi:MAG: hypothetical protein EOM08_15950, partial [Clostridia bacterium]|nr:hypothetical protein [Clostridia bacterium]